MSRNHPGYGESPEDQPLIAALTFFQSHLHEREFVLLTKVLDPTISLELSELPDLFALIKKIKLGLNTDNLSNHGEPLYGKLPSSDHEQEDPGPVWGNDPDDDLDTMRDKAIDYLRKVELIRQRMPPVLRDLFYPPGTLSAQRVLAVRDGTEPLSEQEQDLRRLEQKLLEIATIPELVSYLGAYYQQAYDWLLSDEKFKPISEIFAQSDSIINLIPGKWDELYMEEDFPQRITMTSTHQAHLATLIATLGRRLANEKLLTAEFVAEALCMFIVEPAMLEDLD